MRKSTLLTVLVSVLFLASLVQAQSLAELAKKEKARREALKGKGATVITTTDLAKVKKRPAVESTGGEAVQEVEGGEAAEGQTAPPEQAQPPAGQAQTQQAETAAQEEVIPAGERPLSEKELQAKQEELEKAAREKEEIVELLTLKLNALYQEFYGLDNVKSREVTKQQISDTYDKLVKAEADAKQAKKELEDFVATRKKGSVPEIWIR